MKRKEILIANIFIIVPALIFAFITFNIFSNESVVNMVKEKAMEVINKKEVPPVTTYTCSSKKPLELVTHDEPHLVKLAQYQSVCNSFVTNKIMVFTTFPYDFQSAKSLTDGLIPQLRYFSENGVTPIIIAEPYVGDSEMEYREFLQGKYDSALDTYFKMFKNAGLTDEMMGIWVPFPESNTPNWANKDTDPNDFALVVNRYLTVYKKYFPKAKGSILLSAVTYEPNDLGWENGDYLYLLPYVQNIKSGLVDSFGIQGFPWKSNAQQETREIFKASEFLQPDIAISAAQELRTRDIWLNTGSFYSKYTDDPEKQVQVSLIQRKRILDEILSVAGYIRDYQLNSYRVSINLFSQDKSKFGEATDWSYFQDPDNTDLLKEFLWNAEQSEIPVSLFDK